MTDVGTTIRWGPQSPLHMQGPLSMTDVRTTIKWRPQSPLHMQDPFSLYQAGTMTTRQGVGWRGQTLKTTAGNFPDDADDVAGQFI